MSSTATRLVTAEEFWLLSATGQRLALVRGEVVEAMPAGGEHSVIVLALGSLLLRWARATGAGVVGTEAGFILDRDPDIVRGPDLYFVRAERLPAGRAPVRFFDFAPDLAVEVISPSETAEDVLEKVRDYPAGATLLVVLVYPRTRTVVAHAPDGSTRSYRDGEEFAAPDVLPGFSCPVAAICP